MEIAAGMVGAQQALTQQTLTMSFVKSQLDAQAAMADMIMEVVQSAPQPGQGSQIDITV